MFQQTLNLLSRKNKQQQQQQQTTTPKVPLSQFTKFSSNNNNNNNSNNFHQTTTKVKLCNFKTNSLTIKRSLSRGENEHGKNNESEQFNKLSKEDLERCLTDLLLELKQPIDAETKASIEIQPEEEIISDFSSLNDSPDELLELFSPLVTTPPCVAAPQQQQQQQTRITRKPPKSDTIKFLGGKKPTSTQLPTTTTTESTLNEIPEGYEIVQDNESDRDEEESDDIEKRLIKIIEKHEKHFPTKTRKSKIVELVQSIAAKTNETISIPLQSPVKSKKPRQTTTSTPSTPSTPSQTTSTTSTNPKKEIPYATNKLKHLKVPTKTVSKTIFDPFPNEIKSYSVANKIYKTKFYDQKQWPPENRNEGNKMVVPLSENEFCNLIKTRWNKNTLKDISPSSIGGIFQSQCVTLHETCVVLNIAFHVLKSKIPNDSPINRVFNFWLSYQTNLVKKVGEHRMLIRTTMHKLPPPRQVKNDKVIKNDEDEEPLTFIELGKRKNLVKYIKSMIIPNYHPQNQHQQQHQQQQHQNKSKQNQNPISIPKLPDIIDITNFFPGQKTKITEENICTKHADTFREMLVVSVYMLLAFIPTKQNRKSQLNNYWHEDPIKIPKLVNACNFILTFFNMREYLNHEPDYLNGESVIKPMEGTFDTSDYIHDGKWQSYINQTIIEILNESFVCESLLDIVPEDDIYVMLTPIDEKLEPFGTSGTFTFENYKEMLAKKNQVILVFCETRFAGYMIVVVKNYKNRRKSEDSNECLKPKTTKRIREEYLVCGGTMLENHMSDEAKKLAQYYKKRKYKHYGKIDENKKQL